MTAEGNRLAEARNAKVAWKAWGPYLSERQWGTVREDYSDNGDAWNYFTHDHSRSRTYRWGEDGIAGICDERQRLCFALTLWNGRDPILKERLFGLTNSEGNHGEDVKEYYYYLDSTPTHSYMKYFYKYPQAAYPYADLLETNRKRSRKEFEYELIDTGVFDGDRYFDVFIEYAKEAADDLLIRITACNRGPERATIHLLPTLWFRNTWTWEGSPRPSLEGSRGANGRAGILARHAELGAFTLSLDRDVQLLFTENESNEQRLFGTANASPFVKDGFHEHLIHGNPGAVNPALTGTKAAAHYELSVEAGGQAEIRLRLAAAGAADTGTAFGAAFARRIEDADEFYQSITPPRMGADEALVMRQALAGMLWSKQYYYFNVTRWLREHQSHPMVTPAGQSRNRSWYHMVNNDIISMPDKWEYPWYAAWDLAFHVVTLNMVDPDFARQQLTLMLSEVYQHPNGQIPAYEWNFGDVNPPVHAWAALSIYSANRERDPDGELRFLKDAFHKLLLNFTWWVNRKDQTGRNVFEGGFLGLDNIGVFDRSAQLPTGGSLEQADGTAWMAFYCQTMLEIALELANYDKSYEDLATKFMEHFLWIAGAMDPVGEHADEMWDKEDGFFYDVLRMPDGTGQRLKVRSLVGLLPLCATTVIDEHMEDKFPRFMRRIEEFVGQHGDLLANIASPGVDGHAGRRLLAVVNEQKLRRMLARMLDESRFLAPNGIRSLSRWHFEHPYQFDVHGEAYRVEYMPGESTNGMFGGNSNWRGPVWFPINLLLVRGLLQFYLYYGEDFRIECPTGSGKLMTLVEVAHEITDRMCNLFLRGADGRRPVFGGSDRFQNDPHWKDYLLFYEYYHGDNGAGLGASHQTGWTGCVARLLQLRALFDPVILLAGANRPLSVAYPPNGPQ